MQKARKLKNDDTRERIFLAIIDQIPNDTTQIRLLAERAGVNNQTLRNWKYHETLTPRIDTLCKVAYALGYSIELKKIRNLRAVK